jgi:hypothetical protein
MASILGFTAKASSMEWPKEVCVVWNIKTLQAGIQKYSLNLHAT